MKKCVVVGYGKDDMYLAEDPNSSNVFKKMEICDCKMVISDASAPDYKILNMKLVIKSKDKKNVYKGVLKRDNRGVKK